MPKHKSLKVDLKGEGILELWAGLRGVYLYKLSGRDLEAKAEWAKFQDSLLDETLKRYSFWLGGNAQSWLVVKALSIFNV